MDFIDEIVLFFKDLELFIILFSISPSASAIDKLRRSRSISYIFKKYEINWLIDKYAFIEALKKLIKKIRYVKISAAVLSFSDLI